MLKEKETKRFTLNTRLSRLHEQCTSDRHHVLRWTRGETYGSARIPATHARMRWPITRHCDHYAENTPHTFNPSMR